MERGKIEYTDLEQKVEEALKLLNWEYIPQYPTRTGYVIDFALPQLKVGIEVDGPFHERGKAKKRDRFRDLQLRREGWKIIRINWHEIEKIEPEEIASLLQHHLLNA